MDTGYSEIFLKAADVIRDRGHTRFVLESDDGCVCLAGAIHLVMNGDPCRWSKEAQDAIDSLKPLVPVGLSPVSWNNLHGRTGEEVINLLREAAGVTD